MSNEPFYPQGRELNAQIASRHRSGSLWQILFQVSTVVGVLALTALIYNIISESFGLVAVQNQVDPDELVLAMEEERLLAASNTFTSEDDNELVAEILADPNAIGFFGYSYYSENSDGLKILSVDGVAANAETAVSGQYPFVRPLYIYTAAEIIQENPAANALVNYYLSNVEDQIEGVGYFPAPESAKTAARSAWSTASGLGLQPGEFAVINVDGVQGGVDIAGSSTVFPVTEQIVASAQADGYLANVSGDSIGTTAGLRAFCEEQSIDIANASRPMQPSEFETCRDNGLRPVEIQIGLDTLAIVVNEQNDFLNDVTVAELREIFTTAVRWSDVNAAWPDEPINRYIPGVDSGTLDFFTETTFPIALEELASEDLVDILAANISVGLGRRFERDQRFFADRLVFEDPKLFAEVCASDEPPAACTLPARDQQNIYELVLAEVVAPDVLESWSLFTSLLNREEIQAYQLVEYPNATLEWRSWLTIDFLVNPQSSVPELAGVRTAILGTLWVVAITILFSFPVGVGAAVYLEEYAVDNWLNRLIKTNINNLAGVPSIIYGMLGLTIFVRALEAFSSGSLFGVVEDTTTANGRTIISAGLTLGLLILPVIIIAAQEAIRAVPSSLRQAGMALGATKWQTIWHHVLPSAIPGILTGSILAIARAVGETAPLVVVGASTFITIDPSSPFSKFTVLPIQIFQWTSRPQDEFRNIAAAAIIVLLVLLLTMNATAVILRNRYARRA